MRPPELTLIAPNRQEHGDAVVELLAKVFSGGDYFGFRDVLRRGYFLDSHYDWNVSRIGLVRGRAVTHWGVWDYRMRIGTARVRAGGIGLVATHADYRKRGLMARTAAASIEAMRDAGYDLSILFGIDNFYHRFGYVRAWPGTTYCVSLSDLPTERPGVRLRRFALGRRDDIDAIYNREHARLTGTAVRPTYSRNRYRGRRQGYRWTDARGRTAGYVVVERRGERLHWVESGGDTDQVLRVLATLARRWRCREVRLDALHHETALSKRLRRGNCRQEIHHHRRGGAMVRTVNLQSTLKKMAAELGRRLRGSPSAGWRGSLLVAGGRQKAALRINRSRVGVGPPQRTKHAVRGGDEIAQLLIGTDVPEEIVEAGGMRLSGEARRLLAVLFPNQYPRLGSWDDF